MIMKLITVSDVSLTKGAIVTWAGELVFRNTDMKLLS
jgi:hypothetical protein